MERFNGEIRDSEKVMRGLKKPERLQSPAIRFAITTLDHRRH
jgi:hypothetical protein